MTDSPGMTARRLHQALESDPDREAVLARFADKLPAKNEEPLPQLLWAFCRKSGDMAATVTPESGEGYKFADKIVTEVHTAS